MLEIRFHGRGGTGSVLASRALTKAVFYAGKHAIAIPSFGAERRGALVLAFARIDTKRIYKRTQIYNPDLIVVLDDSLLELVDVVQGLKPDGMAVLNSPKKPEQIKLSRPTKAAVVDATKIAKEFLVQPVSNSAMLGALIKSSDFISFEDLEKGIMSVFGSRLGNRMARMNVEAARIAYEETVFGVTKGGGNNTKIQTWLPTVDELPIGTIIPKMKLDSGQMIGPGAAVSRITGTWSNEKAQINQEKCIRCLQCFFHCPEGTIRKEGNTVKVVKAYCKACGICINVCPVNAIDMVEIKEYKDIFD